MCKPGHQHDVFLVSINRCALTTSVQVFRNYIFRAGFGGSVGEPTRRSSRGARLSEERFRRWLLGGFGALIS